MTENATVEAPAKPAKPAPEAKPCQCSELFVTLHVTEDGKPAEVVYETECKAEVTGKRNYAPGHDAKLKKVVFAATREAAKLGLDIDNIKQVNWDFAGNRYKGPVAMAKSCLSDLMYNQIQRGVERNNKAPEPKPVKEPKAGNPEGPRSSGKGKPRNVRGRVEGKTYDGRVYRDGSFEFKGVDDKTVVLPAGEWVEVTD